MRVPRRANQVARPRPMPLDAPVISAFSYRSDMGPLASRPAGPASTDGGGDGELGEDVVVVGEAHRLALDDEVPAVLLRLGAQLLVALHEAGAVAVRPGRIRLQRTQVGEQRLQLAADPPERGDLLPPHLHLDRERSADGLLGHAWMVTAGRCPFILAASGLLLLASAVDKAARGRALTGARRARRRPRGGSAPRGRCGWPAA